MVRNLQTTLEVHVTRSTGFCFRISKFTDDPMNHTHGKFGQRILSRHTLGFILFDLPPFKKKYHSIISFKLYLIHATQLMVIR